LQPKGYCNKSTFFLQPWAPVKKDKNQQKTAQRQAAKKAVVKRLKMR
jgi:hypothetical protein